MSGISRTDFWLILGGDNAKVDPRKSQCAFTVGFCLEKGVFPPSQSQKLNSFSFPREIPVLTDPRAEMGRLE